MPRRSQVLIPSVPLNLIQREKIDLCFFAEEDYLFYLKLLVEQASKNNCDIHAWCLMTNHVHLLVSPCNANSVSLLVEGVGQRCVQYINRKYGRSGSFWEGRCRSCLVESERYFLCCYRYIEINHVRTEMVIHPAEYRWSS